jgi:hypothetical protein
MSSDSDSFDEPPQAFDEIKLPFIYVPHGEPEPTEWLERHPDYIKMPATFVPRAHGASRTNVSFDTPPPGQHRSVDGLAASSDAGAPWPPAGGAVSDAMSAATNATYGRTFTSDGPITAFLLADAGLGTAASDYALGQAGTSDLDAQVGNSPLNFSDRSGSLLGEAWSALWNAIIPSAKAAPGETEQDRLKVQMGEKTQDQADEHAGVVQIVPNLSRGPILTPPVVGGGGAFSTYDPSITASGSRYPNVQTNVTVREFQANLIANGYSVVSQATGTNPVTVLSNGSSTYTIYTRTSTGSSGAQYIGPDGNRVKFSLGDP